MCGGLVLIGERRARQFLEPHDVDGQFGPGGEHHLVVPQDDGVIDADAPSSEVRSLVQLRRRLLDRVVGPEQVEDLFAVQGPCRRHGQHLHQRRGVTSGPCGLGHRCAVDHDGEVAEERDLDHRHPGSLGSIVAHRTSRATTSSDPP